MSHELTQRANGQVEFAYLESEGPGWHGFGTPVADDAPIEQWQLAAGMEWRALRSKVRYAAARPGAGGVIPADGILEMPEQHVLFRSDSRAPLAIVSTKYHVVQPRETIEFFRDLVEAEGYRLSAAGTIFGGRRFWATAHVASSAPVSPDDKIEGYLLASTSLDGSTRTDVRMTSTRVVCRNTLEVASRGVADASISHRSVFDPEVVKKSLGLQRDAWKRFLTKMERFAERKVSDKEAEAIVARLFGVDAPPTAAELAAAAINRARGAAAEPALPRGYTKVLALFRGEAIGSKLPGVAGTAYGLLQAVTEYADHHQRAATGEHRFANAQWGVGRDLKAAAVKQLDELVLA